MTEETKEVKEETPKKEKKIKEKYRGVIYPGKGLSPGLVFKDQRGVEYIVQKDGSFRRKG
jgi:hypothetical protein